MRIVSWNINSVRLRIESVARLVAELSPDILCLQEIKVTDAAYPQSAFTEMGFTDHAVFGQKGYHGVSIHSRLPISRAHRKHWCGREDSRHIWVTLASGLEVHNFYVPAGGDVPNVEENEKFAHKMAFLDEMTEWFVKNHKSTDPAILVGDLNIAPLETDVWSHKQLLKEVSHTPVEVDGLNGVMAAHKWIDAVRIFVPPEEPLYSWWSYRNRTWPGSNRGRRLDHIWVTPPLEDKLRGASVFTEARGWEKPSDHAPVLVDIDL